MTRHGLLQIWTPGLTATGGIQTFSRRLVEALQSHLPQQALELCSLDDPAGTPQPIPVGWQSGHHPGGRPRFSRFALKAGLRPLQRRPDLIWSTHINLLPPALLSGVPYWGIGHGFEAWAPRHRYLRSILKRARRLQGVSRMTVAALEQHSGDRPPVDWLPNTVAAERFSPGPKSSPLLQRYGLRPDQPVLLTVNRLAAGEEHHPYDRVIEALPEVLRVFPDCRYLIAGSGGDRPRLEALIRARDLEPHVTLCGFVPDTELADHYRLCDLFLMPSENEGFGIVCLEAMACGRPVLASSRDGSCDAVCNGALGLLVDPRDTGAIARRIIRHLQGQSENPLLYAPQELQQRMLAEYGPERFRQRVGELIRLMPTPILRQAGYATPSMLQLSEVG